MKNLFTILMLLSTAMGYGQISLKVGVNRAELNVNDESFYDVKAKTNYLIGLHYLFSFNEVAGLESGIMYQRFSTDFKGGPDIYDFDRDYVAIPILLKFNPGTVFSAGAGLQASFKVRDSFSDNFKNNDFDLSAQVQATVNIFKSLGIEIGYNFGFFPLVEFDNKSIGDVSFKNGKAMNRYYYAAAVIRF